jgi:hypothetical protein
VRLQTTLLLGGKTTTGFVVPPEVVEGLGAGKRPPVRVTINGPHLQKHGGGHGRGVHVGVSAEERKNTGAAAETRRRRVDKAVALLREGRS